MLFRSPDRRRNLCAQQCELALARRDAAAVVARLERFAAVEGDRSGGNYMVASLYAAARGLLPAGAERDRVDGETVRWLRAAFEHREVPRAAARQASFAFLRERPDFQELLAQ